MDFMEIDDQESQETEEEADDDQTLPELEVDNGNAEDIMMDADEEEDDEYRSVDVDDQNIFQSSSSISTLQNSQQEENCFQSFWNELESNLVNKRTPTDAEGNNASGDERNHWKVFRSKRKALKMEPSARWKVLKKYQKRKIRMMMMQSQNIK
jgi:hypothetical protein